MLMFYLQMIESDEDKSKFEKLYMEYRGLMHHVAFEILQHQEDAEDAVHQAFLKVIENLSKIEKPVCSKTKSYLVTIAENKAIDIYRSKTRRNEVSYEELYGISVEYKGTDELSRCLSKLPARYREVLTLKYKLEFDNKAIARMLGISRDALWKLEQRARERLVEICKEEGVSW